MNLTPLFFRRSFRLLLAGSMLTVPVLLSGCSSKLPKTEEISGPELEEAEDKLVHFLDQTCVTSVDSDIRLSWKAYGQEKTYPAVLQATAPSFLRLSVIDPLGRPLLLLGSDGETFTLADNNESVGYTGSTELQFIRRFVPSFIPANDLFRWLGGRINGKDMLAVASTRKDAEQPLNWYEIGYPDKTTHLLALNKENQLSRHLVVDQEKEDVLFDAEYSNYSETTADCFWPGRIDISGKELEAEYAIEFEEILGFEAIEEQRFQVKLPPHFTEKKLIDKEE